MWKAKEFAHILQQRLVKDKEKIIVDLCSTF